MENMLSNGKTNVPIMPTIASRVPCVCSHGSLLLLLLLLLLLMVAGLVVVVVVLLLLLLLCSQGALVRVGDNVLARLDKALCAAAEGEEAAAVAVAVAADGLVAQTSQ